VTDGSARHERAVRRLLRLLGARVRSFADGDEQALETLGDALDETGLSADELHSAAEVLESLGAEDAELFGTSFEGDPGRHAQRILSAEERTRLSPEAWGYLLGLRRHGSLDANQVERVLDRLVGSGVRPVGVDLAREVATRVAFEGESGAESGETNHGDIEHTTH